MRASRWASIRRGNATAARMAMMVMTIISSIRVKPEDSRTARVGLIVAGSKATFGQANTGGTGRITRTKVLTAV